MRVELGKLRVFYGKLPASRAQTLVNAAALGLQRGQHAPGVTINLIVGEQRRVPDPELDWEAANLGELLQHDHNRITEDAAEAIALGLAALEMQWTVLRRLQRGEYADWLLSAAEGKRVAFEVCGTDGVFRPRLLKTELDQVARSTAGDVRAACVVALASPEAVLAQT
jgi:hypothetical protein